MKMGMEMEKELEIKKEPEVEEEPEKNATEVWKSVFLLNDAINHET